MTTTDDDTVRAPDLDELDPATADPADDDVAELPTATREVTAALHTRVERFLTPNVGSGYRGAVVMHEVPHELLKRRADVLAVNFYRDRPAIVGVEIKATRADWDTERRTQAKAVAFAEHCAQWWIAAPDGLIDPGEIPPGSGWGLMVAHGRTSMRAVVQPTTHQRPTVPAWLLVAIAKQIDAVRVAEVSRSVSGYQARAEAAERRAREGSRASDRDAADARVLRELLAAAGITRRAWALYADAPNTPEGRALLEGVGGLARVLALKAETAERLKAAGEAMARHGDRIARILEQVDDEH